VACSIGEGGAAAAEHPPHAASHCPTVACSIGEGGAAAKDTAPETRAAAKEVLRSARLNLAQCHIKQQDWKVGGSWRGRAGRLLGGSWAAVGRQH
jgi:hypothetical protein